MDIHKEYNYPEVEGLLSKVKFVLRISIIYVNLFDGTFVSPSFFISCGWNEEIDSGLSLGLKEKKSRFRHGKITKEPRQKLKWGKLRLVYEIFSLYWCLQLSCFLVLTTPNSKISFMYLHDWINLGVNVKFECLGIRGLSLWNHQEVSKFFNWKLQV